jgi:hypothetical protein
MATEMTKARCVAFEKIATEILTEIAGPATPYMETGLTWGFVGVGGVRFSVKLFCDSNDDGRGYRSSWLACRMETPADWRDDLGFMKPLSDLSWPSRHITYPSGKCNLHPINNDTPAGFRRDVIFHMLTLTAPDSCERRVVEKMEFDTES